MSERFYILGVPVDNLRRQEALQRIMSFLHESKPHFAVAINPEKIMKAVSEPDLYEVLNKSNLNFVDGVGVSWVSRLFLRRKVEERITGIDLFSDILREGEKEQLRVFLVGSREKTIETAVSNIEKLFPNITVSGYCNGYFQDEEEVVNKIQNSNSDILFVGMGSPKQELFIYRNLERFKVKFAMGVGGTFNVYAGEFKRAPTVIQKLGLEWLYRFILDPKRFPRILKLPKFVLLVLRNPSPVKDEVSFLSLSISNRSIESNLRIVASFIEEKGFHLVVTLNGEMAARAINDSEFMEIIRQASLVIPDGVGIIWGARRFGERIKYRIPGIEFAWELLRLCERRKYRVYLLGGKEDVISAAAEKIAKSFPSLPIVGIHHGFFSSDEEVVRDIKSKKPDVLFIGMGGIKQEKWVYRNRDIDVPVCIGVGGSFDVWAGRVRRAPRIIRSLGLEWLFRTVTQPSRLSRTKNLFVFALRVILKKV